MAESPFYTILSFCGGGIRGLLSVKILERLAAHHSQVASGASMLAGTSTGATITGLLAATPLTPSELVASFIEREAPFLACQNHDPNSPAYDTSTAGATWRDFFGDRTLSGLSQHVLLTAFSVGGPKWYPQLFNNVPQKVSRIPQFDNAGMTLVDAVASSGVMPGMLGSYKGNVDGAFVHHDPTLPAIALALNAGIDLSRIAVICIGTGFMANYIDSDTSTWGTNQWLNGDGSGDYHLPPLLVNDDRTSPFLNICLNGTSSNLMEMLGKLMLGDRYVSLNPTLERYIPENASSKKDLDELITAAESVDLKEAKELLDRCW